MQIENINIEPFTAGLDPALDISYDLTTESSFPLPIRFTGYVFIGRVRIAVLEEYNWHGNGPSSLLAQNFNLGGSKKRTDRIRFTADLSRKALDFMMNNRDKKGDLYLNLKLKAVLLKPSFDYYKINETDRYGENRQLIQANNNALFHVSELKREYPYRVISGDWLEDFLPAFNQQKYQVFEIPQPEMLNTEIEVKKKLKEAIDALPHMEEARSKGEWNRVIKESRPIWELVNSKEDLKNTFKGELNDDTWGSLKDLIQNFFTFSSKFIHRISHKDKALMVANNAAKEDAELVYAMAFSIVNFISRKLGTSE